MDDRTLNKIARKIIKGLRHSPETYRLHLDSCGWCEVQQVLFNFDITLEELEFMTLEDNKGRFEWNSDKSQIRASQGHTIDVNLEQTWSEYNTDAFLYHGTQESNIPSILEKGLLPGTRTHVHLSKDVETAKIVGSRKASNKNKLVVLEIDPHGLIMFESSNGVILTKHVPNKSLKILK